MVEPVGSRKKILIVLPFLAGGGAERVITMLIGALSREKFALHLALFANRHRPVNQVPDDVTLHLWNYRKASKGILRLVRLMGAIRPDAVLSTLGYVNLLVMLLRPAFPAKTRFIARESNIPSLHLAQFRMTRLMEVLYRWLYPKFDRIICQSQDMQNDLISAFGITPEKTSVINNPVDIDWIGRRLEKEEQESPGLEGRVKLLAVGKLMPQKGFDLLLRAFSLIEDTRFFLTIIGEGPERENLALLAQDLGIADRIRLAGFTANPYPAMRDADLFILSSRYEGFPNVVLESNACGTPVVAFDCPGGVAEIIRNDFNGWLVKPADIKGLANTIVEATGKPLNRDAISAYIHQEYGVRKIVSRYEKVLGDVIDGRGGKFGDHQ